MQEKKEYLSDSMEIFNESFSGIKDALAIGDVDMLIENANNITESLGGNKPFETMDEKEKRQEMVLPLLCGGCQW